MPVYVQEVVHSLVTCLSRLQALADALLWIFTDLAMTSDGISQNAPSSKTCCIDVIFIVNVA